MSTEEQLINYLEETLSATERAQVEAQLAQSPALRQELDGLREMYGLIDQLPAPEPSAEMSARFYQLLEQEQRPTIQRRLPGWLWQAAAGVAILLLGFWLGQRSNGTSISDLASTQETIMENQRLMMLQMLEQESASARIKAVGYSHDFQPTDQKVIAALLDILQYDPNLNVRIHTAEALYRFGDHPDVRKAFLRGLSTQDDPEMKIKIIDILIAWKETRAVDELLKLLEQDDLIDEVQSRAEKGLEVLL